MPAIVRRSCQFSIAALLTAAVSAAAAQEAQPAAPAKAEPAIRQAAREADVDDGALVVAEPDFRVLNLPSTLSLPVRGSAFHLTHRFNGNLRDGSFNENAGNLFGLDEGAAVGFEYRFGLARHLQASAYRTGLDKTIQFYGKYDAARQRASMPVSVSALVSVEGADNFQERYSPSVGAIVSRMAADRLAVYATPMWVHNTSTVPDTGRDTFFVGLGGRVLLRETVYLVGEVAPGLAGYRPGRPAFGFAVEKRAGGHVFQLNVSNGRGTTFAQIARGGAADSLYLGFNLTRKFF